VEEWTSLFSRLSMFSAGNLRKLFPEDQVGVCCWLLPLPYSAIIVLGILRVFYSTQRLNEFSYMAEKVVTIRKNAGNRTPNLKKKTILRTYIYNLQPYNKNNSNKRFYISLSFFYNYYIIFCVSSQHYTISKLKI